jgi:hypothetical protein
MILKYPSLMFPVRRSTKMPDKDKEPIKPTPPEKPRTSKTNRHQSPPLWIYLIHTRTKNQNGNLEELIREAMKVKRP